MRDEGVLRDVLLRFGPVTVTATVAYTLVVSAALVAVALAVRAALRSERLTNAEVAVEALVDSFESLIADMFGRDPRPYVPLVVTLALFVGVANLLGLVPGLRAPTSDFSTTAALATIVFVAVPFYGVRARGVAGYLKHYLEPTPILAPLEVVTELSRTLALAVRLFGNVMSEELVIGVLLMIAGLLVPVPIMLLAVLTSVVQAYIFTVLTVVYLSAAVRASDERRGES